MSRRVLVLGAGIAGLSAAYAAKRRGAEVTILSAGVGSSALGGGAVDDRSWEAWFSAVRLIDGPILTRPVDEHVRAFNDAFGLWDLPLENTLAPLLATAAGRLRPTRGRDKALLDLGSASQTCVLVPRAPRANWDADALAATLNEEHLARRSSLRFVAIDAPILRFADEARIPDADLAMRHDEPVRLQWLAERLTQTLAAVRRDHPAPAYAFLLGSWLGLDRERATELSTRVGVPVGEILVGVGSSAGFRFEAAQRRFLDKLSLELAFGRVMKLRRTNDRFEAILSDGSSRAAEAIVLATGGVASGGLVYAPPEHAAGEDAPARVVPSFVLAIETPELPVMMGVGAEHVDAGGSLHGPVLDTTAWPRNAHPSVLESVGIVAPEGRVAKDFVAAGDVLAGRRRTLLDAVASGLRAGQTV